MSRRACYVPAIEASTQRVIVKGCIIPYGRNYTQYMMRERDGKEVELFNNRGAVERDTFTQSLTGHSFAWVISPERGHDLDMRQFTIDIMDRVSTDLCTTLQWAGVNHYDTQHPHAHIVIRGVDERGHRLEIDNEFLRNGIRFEASHLATRELGPVWERDLSHDHEHRQEIERELQEYVRHYDMERTLQRELDAYNRYQERHQDRTSQDLERTLSPQQTLTLEHANVLERTINRERDDDYELSR